MVITKAYFEDKDVDMDEPEIFELFLDVTIKKNAPGLPKVFEIANRTAKNQF